MIHLTFDISTSDDAWLAVDIATKTAEVLAAAETEGAPADTAAPAIRRTRRTKAQMAEAARAAEQPAPLTVEPAAVVQPVAPTPEPVAADPVAESVAVRSTAPSASADPMAAYIAAGGTLASPAPVALPDAPAVQAATTRPALSRPEMIAAVRPMIQDKGVKWMLAYCAANKVESLSQLSDEALNALLDETSEKAA